MIKWIKGLFTKNKVNKKQVSINDVKKIYKGFTKKQLIRVILKLINELTIMRGKLK
jgi:hypothetical protein